MPWKFCGSADGDKPVTHCVPEKRKGEAWREEILSKLF